jgi:hypothetical protein
MHWRDEYEINAARDRAAVDAHPVEHLLDDVRQRRFGGYYSLWYSIAARATPQAAGWTLFEALMDPGIDFLNRYHCAAALLLLLDIDRFQPLQLSAKTRPDTASNLAQVEVLLDMRVGPPPPARSMILTTSVPASQPPVRDASLH